MVEPETVTLSALASTAATRNESRMSMHQAPASWYGLDSTHMPCGEHLKALPQSELLVQRTESGRRQWMVLDSWHWTSSPMRLTPSEPALNCALAFTVKSEHWYLPATLATWKNAHGALSGFDSCW